MDKGGNHMVKDSQVDKEERTNVAKRPPEQQKRRADLMPAEEEIKASTFNESLTDVEISAFVSDFFIICG